MKPGTIIFCIKLSNYRKKSEEKIKYKNKAMKISNFMKKDFKRQTSSFHI